MNDGLDHSSNICKAKICPSLEALNMTAGCGFSLTVVSVVSILTLSESLVTALFTALKTETRGNYIRINDYAITVRSVKGRFVIMI